MDMDRMLVDLSKKLTDEGKVIEAGWIGLRLAAVGRRASPEQLAEMRMAFMAGGTHLLHHQHSHGPRRRAERAGPAAQGHDRRRAARV
jgi:hypothetical protein